MDDLDLHYSALDRCRTAIRTAAGQYEDTLVERNPGDITYGSDGVVRNNRTPVSAGTFGHLDDSQALATAANNIWNALIEDMDEARRKLAMTEGGLSTVEENIRSAHRATA